MSEFDDSSTITSKDFTLLEGYLGAIEAHDDTEAQIVSYAHLVRTELGKRHVVLESNSEDIFEITNELTHSQEAHTAYRRRIQLSLLLDEPRTKYSRLNFAEAISRENAAHAKRVLAETVLDIAHAQLTGDSDEFEDILARIHHYPYMNGGVKRAIAEHTVGLMRKNYMEISEAKVRRKIEVLQAHKPANVVEEPVLKAISVTTNWMGAYITDHPQWSLFVDRIIKREELMSYGGNRYVRTVHDTAIAKFADEIGIPQSGILALIQQLDGGETDFRPR